MSSFDEELRRQEAQRRSADARQRSEEDRRRRAAEAAVPRLTQLLREFGQRLSERGVQPIRVKLPSRPGFFRARSGGYSPAGYVIASGTLITPDGSFWRASSGFVPITAENLLNYEFGLINSRSVQRGYIGADPNGNLYLFETGDAPNRELPLEKELANWAMRLINESSGQR